MAKDNIDLNATATMIHSHYHGTSISLLQYPSESNPGISLDYSFSDDSASLSKKLQGLIKEYSEVNPLPFYTTTNNMYTPLCTISLPSYIETLPSLQNSIKLEYVWLDTFCSSFPSHHVILGQNIMHHPKDTSVDFPVLMQ